MRISSQGPGSHDPRGLTWALKPADQTHPRSPRLCSHPHPCGPRETPVSGEARCTLELSTCVPITGSPRVTPPTGPQLVRPGPHIPGTRPPVTTPPASGQSKWAGRELGFPNPDRGDGPRSRANMDLGSVRELLPGVSLADVPTESSADFSPGWGRGTGRGLQGGGVTSGQQAETRSSAHHSVLPTPTYLFRSQMISGLGLPSALQVKNTVFPDVTSASWGSDVIRGLSVPTRKQRSGP